MLRQVSRYPLGSLRVQADISSAESSRQLRFASQRPANPQALLGLLNPMSHPGETHTVLWVASPFFAGILLSRNPPETQGKRLIFEKNEEKRMGFLEWLILKRTVVEKNGESPPRTPSNFAAWCFQFNRAREKESPTKTYPVSASPRGIREAKGKNPGQVPHESPGCAPGKGFERFPKRWK